MLSLARTASTLLLFGKSVACYHALRSCKGSVACARREGCPGRPIYWRGPVSSVTFHEEWFGPDGHPAGSLVIILS